MLLASHSDIFYVSRTICHLRDNFANSDNYHLRAPLFFQNPTAEMKTIEELIKTALQQSNFLNVMLECMKRAISFNINLNNYSPVGLPITPR